MSRETKIGLVVATTFLSLLGVVVASKMRRPETTTTAEVRPENDEHNLPPSGASQNKPSGNPGDKPGELPLTQTGGAAVPNVEPPPLIPTVGAEKQGSGGGVHVQEPGELGSFAKNGPALPAVDSPLQSLPALPTIEPNPQGKQGIELPGVAPPAVGSLGTGEPKKLDGMGSSPAITPPTALGFGEPNGKPGTSVVPPPIVPGKPDGVEPPLVQSVEPPKKDTIPGGELPKVDFPKSDAPKVDFPKAEPQKVEPPMVDFPKVDLPKMELPKTDQPKTDQPKIDVKISQPMPLVTEPKEALPKPGVGSGDTPPSIGAPPLVTVPKTPTVERPIGAPMGELPVTPPVTPPGSGKPLPNVTNHAEERTYAQPGETFEQLSQRLYQSPKYAQALLEYNRKHVLAKANILQNPPQLQPNQAIYWPDKNILEIQFGALISQGAGAVSAVPGAPAVKLTPLGSPSTGNPPTADPTVTLTLTQPRWVFDVARQTLGDGQRWVEILRLNPSLQTEQPIPAGTALRLPATAKLP